MDRVTILSYDRIYKNFIEDKYLHNYDEYYFRNQQVKHPEGGWRHLRSDEVERLVKNNEDAEVAPWEITNGAKGYNSVSRHVVYVGGCDELMRPKDTRTAAQMDAMMRYVRDFHQRFPDVRIIGHNQVSAKNCPCFDVPEWLKKIGINQ